MPAAGPHKELCGAPVRHGEREGEGCRRVAGAGTDHKGVGKCSKHGGNTPSHRARGKNQLAALSCRKLGVAVEVDPVKALLGQIYEAYGNVAFYRELVEELEPGEGGIYGETYHVSGMDTGEAKPHVLVTMYNQERDRLSQVTALALKIGIAERSVRLAESQAEQVALVLRAFAERLGLSPAAPEVREAMRGALSTAALAA